MGTFGSSHHVHISNHIFGCPAHKRTTPPDAEARIASARTWSRDLATCHDHTCHYNIRGEVYDVVPVHGSSYVGKAMTEREAVAIWKDYLISIGEHAEDAEEADGGDLP